MTEEWGKRNKKTMQTRNWKEKRRDERRCGGGGGGGVRVLCVRVADEWSGVSVLHWETGQSGDGGKISITHETRIKKNYKTSVKKRSWWANSCTRVSNNVRYFDRSYTIIIKYNITSLNKSHNIAEEHHNHWDLSCLQLVVLLRPHITTIGYRYMIVAMVTSQPSSSSSVLKPFIIHFCIVLALFVTKAHFWCLMVNAEFLCRELNMWMRCRLEVQY